MSRGPRKKTMIVVAMAAASLLALAAVAPVLAPDGAVAHSSSGDPRVPDAGNSSAVTGNENGDYEGLQEEYREEMLEMLRDHMGVEGAQAEEWADTMLAGCTGGDYGTSDSSGYGSGSMMGGGYGSGGMMGGGGYGSGGMMGGGGYGSGGMMGGGGYGSGGMMGGGGYGSGGMMGGGGYGSGGMMGW